MGVFFMSYDLRKGRDYNKLYKELERLKAVRVLESVWSIKIALDDDVDDYFGTVTLRAHFAKYIDPDDGLVVIRADAWAGIKLDNTPHEF
jgi:hypothetical protein